MLQVCPCSKSQCIGIRARILKQDRAKIRQSRKITRHSSDHENCIFVKCGSRTVKALIDSGATKSCVTKHMVRSCNGTILKSDCGTDYMYTADGTPIEIVGTTVLDINVQGLKMPTKFNVMKKLTHGLILGLDFMIKHEVHLNFKEGVITFENDLVFAHFCRRSSKHDIFVRNQVATVIPPLTEAIIKARIDQNYSMGTSIIEPMANLADRKLAMARSIVSPKDTFTVCRVLNPTNSTIYLKKNLPLGRIEKIDQHSLELVQQKEPISRCKEKDPKLNKAFSADEIWAN